MVAKYLVKTIAIGIGAGIVFGVGIAMIHAGLVDMTNAAPDDVIRGGGGRAYNPYMMVCFVPAAVAFGLVLLRNVYIGFTGVVFTLAGALPAAVLMAGVGIGIEHDMLPDHAGQLSGFVIMGAIGVVVAALLADWRER